MAEQNANKLMDLSPSIIVKAFSQMDLKTRLSNPLGYLSYIYSYSTHITVEKGSAADLPDPVRNGIVVCKELNRKTDKAAVRLAEQNAVDNCERRMGGGDEDFFQRAAGGKRVDADGHYAVRNGDALDPFSVFESAVSDGGNRMALQGRGEFHRFPVCGDFYNLR